MGPAPVGWEGAAAPDGSWAYLRRAPVPALAGDVRRLTVFTESASGPVARHELPSGDVALIIGTGPPIAVHPPGADHSAPVWRHAFVAGLHEGGALTAHAGTWSGVQVDLTPLGARRLWGVPMHELFNRDAELDELLGAAGRRMAERVVGTPGPAERLAAVEGELLRRLAGAAAAQPEVRGAWLALESSCGRVPVRELVRTSGWSERHLAARFRDQVGVTPKHLAQILRFRRAVDLLDAAGPGDLARVAAAAGYADQSHMSRAVRRFSGRPPGELRALRVAQGSAAFTLADAEVTFVQDGAGTRS